MNLKNLKKSRLTLSQVLVGGAIVFAAFLIITLGQSWVLARAVLEEKQEKAKMVQAAELRRDVLKQSWLAGQSAAFAEDRIRRELGWVKPGEGTAILQFEDAAPAPAGQPAPARPSGPPHWMDWLSLFLLP
jgi:hypothetical protein